MNAPPDASAVGGAPPYLLRSLASAVLHDGRGDLELARETRGATIDWGGVYAQHVRLCGAWKLAVVVGDRSIDLPACRTTAVQDGDLFRSVHIADDVTVEQQVAPLATPPGAVRRLRVRAGGEGPASVVVTSSFVPYLLPVMVEGIRPIDFLLETRATELRARHRGFALSLGASVAPSRLYVDRASWRGGHRRGSVEEIGSDHELPLGPEGGGEIRFRLVGGLERDLDRHREANEGAIPDPTAIAEELARTETAWRAGTPRLSFPDAPELERAYDHARSALRRLYTQPAEGMTGLVAGYPWYSTIWCRDLAWMLPAVLWLGDHGWAGASIDCVLRHQATHEIDLLGAEAGELPMQVSPGPVLLFGTSDSTLYYPALARRLVRHAGVPSALAGWTDAIERAVAWAERRADPDTGLFRNGGEVAHLAKVASRFARVRYGIDAPDTTIWDSTDRRDHAIDLQVLWREALLAASSLLLGRAGDGARGRRADLLARLERSLRERYLWPEESYLYDSIRGGVPVPRLRPNALRAVSAGLFEPEVARAIVRRASADDLSTPWGVRTLSSKDPGYRDRAYHDGQVWTIATAWAADAAFAGGETDLGVAYLRTIAERLAAEPYGANECYRGDRAEPFDSCFLLGFSVGPFLSVLFERLWGLGIEAAVPRLEVRPAFPTSWTTASLDGLRVGGGRASLRYRDGGMEVVWSGARSLELVGPRGRTAVPPGSVAWLRVR